ncbi:acetyltransferase, GNAT family protein [Roseobacter sp. SK209-2-6]|uniref:GNAT family N-acetyltransferase n=1 Tax=Roseobacter sp. SK209-2-6 TaxID=388739 RepID=UPI0000F3F4BA|nr:GNAT family N-acetyltransferase [Roseobacter sp. SK209-2-6]EBA14530.1 acetyltransferase, GNAT family protein [Roseobacter sp. SK209-2-6]
MQITLKHARPEDIPALAVLWNNGWQEAHAAIVPEALTRLRTLESFQTRLTKHLPATRVAWAEGQLMGFSMILGNELYQLYVAPAARGTGTAQILIQDAEDLIRAAGHERAILACSIGNERAAQFYRNCGWICTGETDEALEVPNGRFTLTVWRFERELTGQPA